MQTLYCMAAGNATITLHSSLQDMTLFYSQNFLYILYVFPRKNQSSMQKLGTEGLSAIRRRPDNSLGNRDMIFGLS
jgi:hypothetical protein